MDFWNRNRLRRSKNVSNLSGQSFSAWSILMKILMSECISPEIKCMARIHEKHSESEVSETVLHRILSRKGARLLSSGKCFITGEAIIIGINSLALCLYLKL
ncbi:hypothetical protein CEXT_17911 [Caerostris extrusa]|uniref:Uncharacterized protein n=1 Tax=Caerostris extrusa TaxID=172846 RepID=A0AAV4UK42_CAEEX|nr:hypothetical protein CEXT_17911 [Caerostris extrusa]